MRVSLEWLSEYVDIEYEPEELARILSLSGTSVERIIRTGQGVSGVVVGRVVSVEPHPNAHNLKVALVEDGSYVREIVCGAPNLRAGMKSALALPGARLPAVSKSELKRANIRGVTSDGMLCSAAELGLSEDASGIIELAPDALVGEEINSILPIEDVILDLEITPNRPDCMSMVGIAREIAALSEKELKVPQPNIIEIGPPIDELAKVSIKDEDECPRYTARVVCDVQVSASPAWVQRRLIASGFRPINNVVDVTNYVLLEMGQPLHAFDLDLIDGKTIIVRLARAGEAIRTLDGVDRQLDERSLVIADLSKPVALAGVMGGEDTGVTEVTKNVLIESACFNPTSIYLTSKRLGLRSESSSRFERGTDPTGTAMAASRAAELMVQFAGGRIASGLIDLNPRRCEPRMIDLRPERANSILGCDIPKSEMIGILERLDMDVSDGEVLNVTIPGFRRDIEREIDLVEEIARIYGYDKIPSSLPGGGGSEAGLPKKDKVIAGISGILEAQGLFECVTLSFMRPTDLDFMTIPIDHKLRNVVALLNPLAETGEYMRTTLLPGLLRVALNNINRGIRGVGLFEIGRVFFDSGFDELPREVEMLGILLCGSTALKDWLGEAREYDFFDIKGIVENLFEILRVKDSSFERANYPYLDEGQAACVKLGGSEIGYLGRIKKEVLESFGLSTEAFAAEVMLEPVIKATCEPDYRAVGRFPNVKLDLALVVDEEVEYGRIIELIVREGGSELKSVRLFDIYRGPQIPEGKKSLAFALEFGLEERTMTDDEAQVILRTIVEKLEREIGARMRS